MTISLYFLTMAFFDGIEFLLWNNLISFPGAVDKRFDGYYALQFNYAGHMVYAVDNRRPQTIDGPCLLVTGPGHRYRFGAPHGEARHHVFVAFMGPRVKRWVAGGLLELTSRPVRITEPEQFYNTMNDLHQAIGPSRRSGASGDFRITGDGTFQVSGYVQNAQRAIHLLESLMLLAIQQPRIGKDSPADHKLRELARRIREQPTDDWSFEAEARALGLSLSHFRSRFQSVNRMPAGQLLREARLTWAAWKLRNTTLAVKDIANMSGARDVYYFTRIFSRRFHAPPARYRRLFRAQ